MLLVAGSHEKFLCARLDDAGMQCNQLSEDEQVASDSLDICHFWTYTLSLPTANQRL